jgi:hypothetical protein
MSLARLKSVAGVRIPDTALCNAAVDLLESSSPQFLCTLLSSNLHFRQSCREEPRPVGGR